MKPIVEIGSRYEGICLDRPCLRQMPRNWVLEETRKERTIWRAWFCIEKFLVLAIVFVLAYSFAAAAYGVMK